jgi:hypothetical protein
MNDLTEIPKPVQGLTVRELGETVIIISESGDKLHTLETVGAFIWKAIDGKSEASTILDKICNTFEVDRMQAEKDLFLFLEDLRKRGLIVK